MVVESDSVVLFFKNITLQHIQIQNHALSLLHAPLLHMYVFKAEQTFQHERRCPPKVPSIHTTARKLRLWNAFLLYLLK